MCLFVFQSTLSVFCYSNRFTKICCFCFFYFEWFSSCFVWSKFNRKPFQIGQLLRHANGAREFKIFVEQTAKVSLFTKVSVVHFVTNNRKSVTISILQLYMITCTLIWLSQISICVQVSEAIGRNRLAIFRGQFMTMQLDWTTALFYTRKFIEISVFRRIKNQASALWFWRAVLIVRSILLIVKFLRYRLPINDIIYNNVIQ